MAARLGALLPYHHYELTNATVTVQQLEYAKQVSDETRKLRQEIIQLQIADGVLPTSFDKGTSLQKVVGDRRRKRLQKAE